ncbi:hypothetical protein SNOG_10477 [Parastagonospora nodorum SN15]|uniref:Uncharacterized protein n=1 Tax=Phaeosphaeria nodorum (strain SN15 / ATCC MYA-4574 / FGSC 10173) TaxID=321614 RepID=Q0UCN7_PHANO|nr:hypothetical protein SNOG_10477 [Parastagonospora nodorum SN15]EAT81871.1 hypothetical protein SNOG_10477 [Parastagonospora nodorum SN15]
MSHPALPFFSLPKHVRLLVYEQLESSNKYVHLSNQPDQDPDCAILTMQDALSRSSMQILLPMRGNAAETVVLFLGAAGPSEEVHDISVVRSSKAWLMTQEGRHKVDGMVAKLPRTLASKVNHYVETFS